MNNRADQWDRRKFLHGLALAGTAGLAGLRPGLALAEPPPETPTLRIGVPLPAAVCAAPTYVAEALLKAEGFTDVQYVTQRGATEAYQALASGELALLQPTAAAMVIRVDAGDPVVLLSGVHVGCFELFGQSHIRTVHDLKGKAVEVSGLGSGRHVVLASMLAHVGLDPRKDVNFVTHPVPEGMRLFAAGRVDAFMGSPPEPQELRAKKIGHVVVNTTFDRPWSQYFCCVVAANRSFVQTHPVATRRALRAVLKAANVCSIEPERSARSLVDKGYATNFDYALQTIKELPYARWREYDPEDTVRFYSLRLHEAGLIKSSPQKIISRGTDWRFLNELKKELKG